MPHFKCVQFLHNETSWIFFSQWCFFFPLNRSEKVLVNPAHKHPVQYPDYYHGVIITFFLSRKRDLLLFIHLTRTTARRKLTGERQSGKQGLSCRNHAAIHQLATTLRTPDSWMEWHYSWPERKTWVLIYSMSRQVIHHESEILWSQNNLLFF